MGVCSYFTGFGCTEQNELNCEVIDSCLEITHRICIDKFLNCRCELFDFVSRLTRINLCAELLDSFLLSCLTIIDLRFESIDVCRLIRLSGCDVCLLSREFLLTCDDLRQALIHLVQFCRRGRSLHFGRIFHWGRIFHLFNIADVARITEVVRITDVDFDIWLIIDAIGVLVVVVFWCPDIDLDEGILCLALDCNCVGDGSCECEASDHFVCFLIVIKICDLNRG